jgi:hypothetical protein
MSKNLKPYPIRVEEELLNKFRVVAKANHRSIIGQLSFIMEQAVIEFETRHCEIKVDEFYYNNE